MAFCTGRANIDRLHHQFGRMGKVVDLGDDLVEPVDLLDHDFVEILPEIGVIETFGQKLRKSLDRDEWVSNFVRHAGGQIRPEGSAIEQFLFLPQVFFRGHVLDDGDRAERRLVIDQPAGFDGERAPRVRIDPLLRAARFALALERLAQERGRAGCPTLRPV